MTAGAVVPPDVVWWVIIYPFLTAKDYKLSFVSVPVIPLAIACFTDGGILKYDGAVIDINSHSAQVQQFYCILFFCLAV